MTARREVIAPNFLSDRGPRAMPRRVATFTADELVEWHELVAVAPGSDLPRHEARLRSAERLGAVTGEEAKHIRKAIADRAAHVTVNAS